jgi:hypothetical protein
VRVGILGVLLDNNVEIFHRFFVHLNHLVSFGSLVDVPNVRWNMLYAFAERKNTLLKFLNAAVSQSNVVVNIRLVS